MHRRLCAKLYLKAESQQVDRILEEFSRRYWDCNPTSMYGSASKCLCSAVQEDTIAYLYSGGLVHAVCYSVLLLNTDLHVADLSTRMSRNQFVRNTLGVIQMQLHPSRNAKGSVSDMDHDDSNSVRGNNSDGQETISMGRSKRSGSVTSWNSIARDTVTSTPGGSLATGSGSQVTSPSPGEQSSRNGSTTSVYESKPQNSSATSIIYNRSWEIDMENLLKVLFVNSFVVHRDLKRSPTRTCTMQSKVSKYSNLSPVLLGQDHLHRL
jgi:PH and SEC7 domain-containing protein